MPPTSGTLSPKRRSRRASNRPTGVPSATASAVLTAVVHRLSVIACRAAWRTGSLSSDIAFVTAATALMSPNADRLTAQRYDVSKGYIFIGKYKIGDAHNRLPQHQCQNQ